ncbi:MAG TPA: phosphatidylglycerol lysyltransferase domain-containing protein [Candidatus Saccharimonadales bacterium]|nr:phosphatidylglycerol lysyltransferase domain-containing protein [Candidatus Saccharimonadales bacterium]
MIIYTQNFINNEKQKIDLSPIRKNLIPLYPEFKNLELSDKFEIENLTKEYKPYSDFNFASLWGFNTEEDALISILNKNLVIQYQDYITKDKFFTFIGSHHVYSTILILLETCKKKNMIPQLKLIPHECIFDNKLLFDFFSIHEDRDNFDYIFSTEKLISISGPLYEKKRNHLSSFKRQYPNIIAKSIDLSNEKIKESIFDLFYIWEHNKKLTREETAIELKALSRIIKYEKYFNLLSLGFFDKDKLIGFCFAEILKNQYAQILFSKADTSYHGLFEFIHTEVARQLYKRGCIYENREQDLGLENLRKSKESWQPTTFLKKYIISEKIMLDNI